MILDIFVVACTRAYEHPCLTPSEAFRRDPGVLHRLISHLQQESLLRVQPQCFSRRHSEERSIEFAYSLNEASLSAHYLTRHAWPGIVYAVYVEPVRRNLRYCVNPISKQLPEFLRATCPRESASDPNHSYRFIS